MRSSLSLVVFVSVTLLSLCVPVLVSGNDSGPMHDIHECITPPPLGSAENECAVYGPGLTSISKDNYERYTTSRAAQVVIIKSALCYTIYHHVCANTPVYAANNQDISHITYCGAYTCPAPTSPPTTPPTTPPTAPPTAPPTTPPTQPPTQPPTTPPTTPPTSAPTDPNAPTGPSGTLPPGGASGDPQFAGFHGQSFQFHGLADEVFNLISSPTLQLNGHFVYLSSGSCTYNYTECWTHPGTYIDQLGFAFQDHQVILVAGPHGKGLHLAINEDAITRPGTYAFAQPNGADVTITLKHHNVVVIKSAQFLFTVYNSDHFFNIETSLLDRHLLRIGSTRHTITDRVLCAREAHVDETKFAPDRNETGEEVHQHGAVEAALQQKYGGVQVPLHGLIGQTWRNALVCGKHWIGAVTDYVASDLFASDYFFNFYTSD